jgi:acyl-CoA synthetase (NDP forming)
VIVAVPALQVEQVIEACGAAHVGAAVVLSAGFGEMGGSGVATESRLISSVRRHDLRLVRPNCIGLINTDPLVRLNATSAAIAPTLVTLPWRPNLGQ